MAKRRLTARQLLDRRIPESAFMESVIEAGLRLGWLVFHLNDQLLKEAVKAGRFDALAGIDDFPDLVMIHPGSGQMAVLECKSETGKVQDGQLVWLSAWRNVIDLLTMPARLRGEDDETDALVMIDVVRPSDWDRIEAFLRGATYRERIEG